MAGIVIPPGDVKSVWLGGLGVVFKVSGEETGGSFSVVEHPIEPGMVVRPHMHQKEDEFSYVLEGEIGAWIGEQDFQAVRGSYVWKPRGIPHTFWNPGPKPARLIEFIAPGGLENYFQELASLLQASRPPDMAKYADIVARYGVVDARLEWLPELKEKYHLKMVGE